MIDQKEMYNMKVERRIFFIAIASILSLVEEKSFFCKETITQEHWGDIDKNSSDSVVAKYRKYTVESSEGEVLSHTLLSSKKRNTSSGTYFADNLDKWIPYSEIEPNISLLSYSYPYIEEYTQKLLEICHENEGHLSLEKVIELEQEYVSNNEDEPKKLNLK